ncbi:MAG: hypothetical protein HC892_05020 [Saprospiraceae bacterium]|nr:hypothetical protein [Saprospiraceae bacterium]
MILDTNDEDNTDLSEEETDEETVIEEHELILSTTAKHYLPKGDWYDFYTNQRLEGKQFVEVDVDLAHIPMYILAGSTIPMYPVQQYVGAIRIELVTLKVYFDAEQDFFESVFFEDNGDGYDYKSSLTKENYTYRIFIQESEPSKFFLTQFVEDYRNVSYQFLIQVIGLPFTPTICELDGQPYPFEQTNWVSLTCPSSFESLVLR